MSILSGLGNPLLDTIIQVDFDSFSKIGAEPGSMNLVDSGFSKQLLQLEGEKTYTPGGSCSNTLRGIAWLQKRTLGRSDVAYLGAVGRDGEGDRFENDLRDHGVKPLLARKQVATGTSTILVTPDHERTMFTYLGACREFSPADLPAEIYPGACYFHLTGYMWDTEDQKKAAKEMIEMGLESGINISFDLADPFVVQRYGEELRSYLPGKVHILFANKEELSNMTGEEENDKILEAAAAFAGTVVMKTGAKGCEILTPDGPISVPGDVVEPADTTGAGDSFAAGYLFGLLQNFTPQDCGRLANRIASRIVITEGCSYTGIDFQDIEAVLPG